MMNYAMRLAMGFGILVLMLQLGDAASKWLPLPGPLIGMLLLFGLMSLPTAAPTRAAVACGEHLLKHYAFFFIPSGAGVIAYIPQLRAAWFAIAMSLLISSIISTIVTASVMHWLIKRRRTQAALPLEANDGAINGAFNE